MDNDEQLKVAIAQLNAQMEKPEVKEWLAMRKEAGTQIDPETAEVEGWYAQTLDPYGVCPCVPEELGQVGREYFARSPESDIWVEFSDLPEATVERLRKRIEAGDFNESDAGQNRSRLSPLTFDQARKEVQFALQLHLDTSGMVIEEFSRLPDGRFQFIICEHRPGTD